MTLFEVNKLVSGVCKDLKPLGVYVYHRAITTNSVYLKFKDKNLGSLRISDHEGRSKYSYKWNLREDVETFVDKWNCRFYFNTSDTSKLIETILRYSKYECT